MTEGKDSERRTEQGRRSGRKRRVKIKPVDTEQRNGSDRRSGKDRRK